MLAMESTTHSFAARRSAASTLPGSFNLPPIPNPQDTTPRVSNSEGLSPLSSNIHNSGAAQATQATPLPSSNYSSYQPGSWPTPGSSTSSSYVYTTSTQDQGAPLAQPSGYNPPPSANTGRGMYSPSMSYNARGNTQSPATGNDNMSSGPPPTNYGLPPYSSSATQSTIPSHSHQSILSSQAPVSQAPQQSTTPAADSYSRPPPQAYYPQTSTPQQQSYSAFPPHPPHQPPHHSPTSSAMANRGLVSSIPGPHSPALQPPPSGYGPPRYPYPPVPHGMGGSVLSNISSPNNPMTLVNGGLGVHHASMYSSMYGHPPAPANDRPFKCDQCPQSFNRNHDLKRHKRIHLAVKPFPCSHCDKSFSRKDALKRHKLVKGCGSKDDSANSGTATSADSANQVSHSTNDSNADDTSRTASERDPNPSHT